MYSPKLFSYPAHTLTVPLLTLRHSSTVPAENPDSWSCDISEESWWVKSLHVLHRHNSWWSTQPKEGNWSTHSAHTKPSEENCPHRAGWTIRVVWSGWILSSGLETWLVWTLKGHMVCPRPWTVLKNSGDNKSVWKGGMDKKNVWPPCLKTTPSCAQRLQEVQLNSLAPAASKRASKLREDCIFLRVFFFFCHLRIYHETSMCQTTLLVHKENLCEGIMMKEKDRLVKRIPWAFWSNVWISVHLDHWTLEHF